MAQPEIVFLFQASPEGGYEARDVGYSIFTHGETMDELKANAKDAVACHFAESEVPPDIRFLKAPPSARIFGSAKGEFTVPDDFNDPLPKEIEDLFYE